MAVERNACVPLTLISGGARAGGGALAGQAKRHHVVSKFYLRYFADEANQVTTVMLPGEPTFTQSIERATVRTRFYTAIGHDGQPTDAAETAFSGIETVASDAWRELAEGVWPLTAEARERVAGWIALQLLRGSGNRASMSQLGTDMLQMELIVGGRRRLREVLRDLGEPHDEEALTHEWISLFENPLEVEAHSNHHIQHIAKSNREFAESVVDTHHIRAEELGYKRPSCVRSAE